MRRPENQPLTTDERFREIAQILAAGILRLRTCHHPIQPEHVSPSQNLPDSPIHVLEPRPQPSLIH